MSSSKIEIQNGFEGVVYQALVGNCNTPFEIQSDPSGSIYFYLVDGRPVPKEVFFDALELAKIDRFDPKNPEYYSSDDLEETSEKEIS